MDFKEKVNPSVQSISDLFSANQYRIPVYQRGYSWGNDQVLDLWEDLMEVVNGGRDSHFFGQIVTFNAEDDFQELIDGQQRVTTSQILLAAIKNVSGEIKKELDGKAKVGFEELLPIYSHNSKTYEESSRALDDGNRLVTKKSSNEENIQAAFVNLVLNGRLIDSKTKNKAINNMWDAYDNFYKWIKKDLKGLSINDQINRLSDIFDSFFNKFYIVKVLAPNRQDAFTIFETLNSRGAVLTASDIIKSHIISLLSLEQENIDWASSKWSQLDETLDSDSKKINNFIRSYWSAKNSHVTASKLYRKIIQTLNTEKEAKEFLSDTADLVRVYANIQGTGRKNYFNNPRINHALNILGKIKFTLYYPIILSLEHLRASEDVILKVLNKVISIFIRYRLICNRTTNLIEGAFSTVAIKIWRGDLVSSESIINELDKYNVSDAEVKSSFMTLQKEGSLTGQKRWVLNYLLASIYEESFTDFNSDKEMYERVFNNGDYVPIHINSSMEFEELENYLGNWTIIEGTLHGNKDSKYDMEKMVSLLEASNLETNHRIAERIRLNNYQWTQSDIEERQNELGRNVVNIWH
ncbi:DUF262 domain-containing protein [Nicoliella lavandulae]|uniref:DUF262 domain-containing protein n=1 Tax=Nicoliella lavandulae TaxID=3082954 RepID=A0ABU8SJ27_9LACO